MMTKRNTDEVSLNENRDAPESMSISSLPEEVFRTILTRWLPWDALFMAKGVGKRWHHSCHSAAVTVYRDSKWISQTAARCTFHGCWSFLFFPLFRRGMRKALDYMFHDSTFAIIAPKLDAPATIEGSYTMIEYEGGNPNVGEDRPGDIRAIDHTNLCGANIGYSPGRDLDKGCQANIAYSPGWPFVFFSVKDLRHVIMLTGDADTWKWASKHGLPEKSPGTNLQLATHAGNLSILKSVYPCYSGYRNDLHLQSTSSKPEDYSKQAPLVWICNWAAACGRIHILKWTMEMGVFKYRMACTFAIKTMPGLEPCPGWHDVELEEKEASPLETIKWMNENGWPLVDSLTIFDEILERSDGRHMDVALWLLEQKFPFDRYNTVAKIFRKISDPNYPGETLLKELVSSSDFPILLEQVRQVMKRGNMDLFEWLMKNIAVGGRRGFLIEYGLRAVSECSSFFHFPPENAESSRKHMIDLMLGTEGKRCQTPENT